MKFVLAMDVHKAIQRIIHSKSDVKLDISAANYDASHDAWNMSDADAHRVEMLCGPYYKTVLKIMEVKSKNEEAV